MNSSEHTRHIQLEQLELTCRGDKNKMKKYLDQFLTLIPERVQALGTALENGERIMIRQILHKMSPQLQFFGLNEIVAPIQKLEYDHESMDLDALTQLVKEIIIKLDSAVKEVAQLSQADFS